MNTTPPTTFFEDIPYDEVDHYDDYCYGYSESTDFEFMSDEELEALEKQVWGDDK